MADLMYTITRMRTGRPKKKVAERQNKVLCARFTTAEYSELLAAAKKVGLTPAQYAKKKLVGG
jgi:hypothetical protein